MPETHGSTTYMPAQIKDRHQVTRVTAARGDHDPHPLHGVADPTTQRVHDLLVQLMRQGLDVSLRSLQVWADLARQLGSTALGIPVLGSTAGATYDLFEKLLAAQREVVDELVTTQRQFAHGSISTTPTVGEGLASQ
jgi:hypothetical protein